MKYLFSFLCLLQKANALIDYPIASRLYTTIHDKHLAGPAYVPFDAYVCNKETYVLCKNADLQYVGIAKDEIELSYFHGAHALLTYENTTLTHNYKVPVLGLSSKHVDYGLSTSVPFFVRIYNVNLGELFFKYIMMILIGCIALSIFYKCTISHIIHALHKRRIMKTVTYNEDNLLNSNCTICLDDFKNNEKLMTLTDCKHVFHKECINTWLDTKQTCPNCQNPIV